MVHASGLTQQVCSYSERLCNVVLKFFKSVFTKFTSATLRARKYVLQVQRGVRVADAYEVTETRSVFKC